ncbi:hypothetical protein [Gemmiger sp.]
MMRRKNQQADPPPLRAATLTLLLAAVIICLALLGVLCLATARADLALAERQLSTVYDDMTAETVGAQWYREADQSRYDKDTVLTADLDAGVHGDMTLHIEARADENGAVITQWNLQRDWTPDEGNKLWDGQ